MEVNASSGIVKSFSIRNGYGFIQDAAGGEDIFFGKEQIPVEWQALGPKLTSFEVIYEIFLSPEGKAQARNVKPAKAPQIGQITSGIVKSWNGGKGFGFLQALGLDSDVFFARDRLPQELQQNTSLDGQAMIFKLSHADNGKFQAHNMSPPNHEGSNQQGGARKRPLSGDLGPLATKRINIDFGSGGIQIGSVKSFSVKNGFGFITSPVVSGDVIMYQRDIFPSYEPQQGETVEFTMKINPKGKPQAYDIKPSSGSVPQATGGAGFYPALTIDDIKLYTEQLSPQDLSELATFTSQVLQTKLSGR